MIGKWIDSLTDEQRDRIVEGQLWGVCGTDKGNPNGPRCVLQYADWDSYWNGPRRYCVGMWGVAIRFDKLCDRFGIDRVVRACKLRAGAMNDRSLRNVVAEGGGGSETGGNLSDRSVHINVNRSLFVNREHA